MAAPKVLPPASELRRMVEAGMTQAQIAEHIYKDTGHKVSRSAVSVALHRAGLTKDTPRYREELPWRVQEKHLTAYPARMLRLLGRLRAGRVPLTKDDDTRLRAWLAILDEWETVVAYSPTVGFMYVDDDEVGDRPNGIPIRPRTILDEELPDSLLRPWPPESSHGAK